MTEVLLWTHFVSVEITILLILGGIILIITGSYGYAYVERLIQRFGPNKRDAQILTRDTELLKKRQEQEEKRKEEEEKEEELPPPLTLEEIEQVEQEHIQAEEKFLENNSENLSGDTEEKSSEWIKEKQKDNEHNSSATQSEMEEKEIIDTIHEKEKEILHDTENIKTLNSKDEIKEEDLKNSNNIPEKLDTEPKNWEIIEEIHENSLKKNTESPDNKSLIHEETTEISKTITVENLESQEMTKSDNKEEFPKNLEEQEIIEKENLEIFEKEEIEQESDEIFEEQMEIDVEKLENSENIHKSFEEIEQESDEIFEEQMEKPQDDALLEEQNKEQEELNNQEDESGKISIPEDTLTNEYIKDTGKTINEIISKPKPEIQKQHHTEKLFELTNQAKTQFALWNINETRSLIIEWLSLKKDHRDLNLLLGQIYEKNQEYDKAELVYKDIAIEHTDDSEVLKRLANVLIITKKISIAYEIYKKLLTLGQDLEDNLYITTHLARELEDFSDVYKYWHQYEKQWPNNKEILSLISEAEILLGKKSEAIATLKKLKNLNPYDAEEIQNYIDKITTEQEMEKNFHQE